MNEYRVPSFCPICEMPMKGQQSTRTYYKYGCCSNCEIQWIEGRETRWAAGWRPSAEAIKAFVNSMTQSSG